KIMQAEANLAPDKEAIPTLLRPAERADQHDGTHSRSRVPRTLGSPLRPTVQGAVAVPRPGGSGRSEARHQHQAGRRTEQLRQRASPGVAASAGEPLAHRRDMGACAPPQRRDETMKTRNILLVAMMVTSLFALSGTATAHTCAAYNDCDASACTEGENHEHTD